MSFIFLFCSLLVLITPRSDSFKTENTSIELNSTDGFHTTANIRHSIEEFCGYFNISLPKCSCEIVPVVCKFRSYILDFKEVNTTDKRRYARSNAVTLTYVSVAIFSSLFGVVGNTAVLLIAYQERAQLSPCKLHIAELAFVNFIFSIVQIINIAPLYITNKWIYGVVMCKVLRCSLEVASLLSSGFFQVITLQRYFLVTNPLNIKKIKESEKRLRHVVVIINIIVAIATTIPYFIGLNIEDYSGRCVMFHGDNENMFLSYSWFVIGLYSFTPISITAILSIKLSLYFLKEAKGETYDQTNRSNVNRRIMQQMLLVLSLFVLCTLPSRVINIYLGIHRNVNTKLYIALEFISYVTYSLQNQLNPILYSMLAKEWRKSMANTWNLMYKTVKKPKRNERHPLTVTD